MNNKKTLVFNTDLDNTIIYSYKHDIGNDKINVEVYEDREISFITKKTERLLKEVNEKVLLVPTTTRTIEQYQRIDLGIGVPKYALTCNGGVLLRDGVRDEEWYKESLELVRDCGGESIEAIEYLEKDVNRILDVRFIENLFVYTKSSEPEKTIEFLRKHLNTKLVDVFNNGVKVYVVPKKLSKGMAIKRFKKLFDDALCIAAGDSEFDISMLNEADMAIAPQKILDICERIDESLNENVVVADDKTIFSDKVLEFVLENCDICN
ncbi:MAG: HAD hydrolase family protein [Lachnospiraceae bacterium]|nr:HAD hydrolase family protein [Lachnospiraceae bacterium]